jgi:hypothetical protein
MMILGISSCVAEFPAGNEEGEVSEAKGILHVPMTRGDDATPEESDIATARMIVFKTNGDFVLNTNQPRNPASYLQPTFLDTVPSGYLNVYLIANERAEWNLANITSEAQLKNVLYNYPSYYTTHLPEADGNVPMFGEHRGLHILPSGGNEDLTGSVPTDPTSYPITIQRIFAKVTLIVNCQFSDQNNGNTALKLDSVQLWHIPAWSSLIAERFTGTFTDAIQPFHPNQVSPLGWPSSTYTADANSFRDSISFYLPEYMVNDTSLYSYLSLRVSIKEQSHIAKTYKLILGEGLIYNSTKFMRGDSIITFDNGSTHERDVLDLSIRRNTHYKITATIKNFSLTGNEDLAIYMKVEDWRGFEQNDEPVDYTFNVSQSDFSIPVGHTGLVYIETNYREGWSASVEGSLVLNGGVSLPITGQDSGPLQFRATAAGTHYINIQVGKVTKRIRVIAS